MEVGAGPPTGRAGAVHAVGVVEVTESVLTDTGEAAADRGKPNPADSAVSTTPSSTIRERRGLDSAFFMEASAAFTARAVQI